MNDITRRHFLGVSASLAATGRVAGRSDGARSRYRRPAAEAKAYWEAATEENWGYGASGMAAYHEQFPERRGKGLSVTVLDTGFDTDHPLYNPVWRGDPRRPYHVNVVGVETTSNRTIDDRKGHGTAVLGVIWQAAPNADFHVVRTSGSDSWQRARNQIDGFEYARSVDSDVVSLSAGAKTPRDRDTSLVGSLAYDLGCAIWDPVPTLECARDRYRRLVERLERAAGATADAETLVVAGAGNRSESYDYPASPATSEAVVSVSSTKANTPGMGRDTEQAVDRSGSPANATGENPDVAAPGEWVTSLAAGTESLSDPGESLETYSGSSLATPHVSGAGLLLSRHGSAEAVERAIYESAEDLSGSLDGHGALATVSAYEALTGSGGGEIAASFEGGLGEWQVGPPPHRDLPARNTPGEGGWSQKHGGSVRLHVEGSPSTVALYRRVGSLDAGTRLTAEYAPESFGWAATATLDVVADGETIRLEKDRDDGRDGRLSGTLPRDVGEAYLVVKLVTWPGEATLWVKGVRTEAGSGDG